MARAGKAKKARVTTGIEFGDHFIRVATVLVRSGRASIRALSQASVESGRPGVLEDLKANRREALRTALSRHPKDLGTIVVGIPRESVVSRVVSLPSTDNREVREMLFFDAERFLPFPAEEAEISYRTLEQIGATESRVLMVAARRGDLYEVLDDLDSVGIHPDRIDVDVHGCSYGVLRDGVPEEEPFALLHIDVKDSTLGLVVNGQIRFSRTLGAGTDNLNNGLTSANPDWANFTRVLKRTLAGFSHEEFGTPPKRIVLCGPGSEIRGIATELVEEFDLPVTIPPAMNPGKASEPVCAFGKAIGLALEEAEQERHINLIPEEIYQKYETIHRKRFLVNATLLLVINLALAGTIAGHGIWHKTQVLKILDKKILDIQPDLKDIDKIAEQLEVIDANIDRENTAFRVLKNLFEITPDIRIKIEQLTFEKSDSVEMSFDTFELRDVNDYQTILADSEYFVRAEVSGTTTRDWPADKWKYPRTIKANGMKAFLRSNKAISK